MLVNDGSLDDSGDVCRSIAANPLLVAGTDQALPVGYIEHSRNYGEHNAVIRRHAFAEPLGMKHIAPWR